MNLNKSLFSGLLLITALFFISACSNTSVSGRIDNNTGDDGSGLNGDFEQHLGIKTADEIYNSMIAITGVANATTRNKLTQYKPSLPVSNNIQNVGPTHYNAAGNLAYELCKEALRNSANRNIFLAGTPFINGSGNFINITNNPDLQNNYGEWIMTKACGEEVVPGGTSERAQGIHQVQSLIRELAADGVNNDGIYRGACYAALASSCVILF